MQTQTFLTYEQRQYIYQYDYDIAKFFLKKNFLSHEASYIILQFRNRLKSGEFQRYSCELGVWFMYHILCDNRHFFSQNKNFDFGRYFTKAGVYGWTGFAYMIFVMLKKNDIDEIMSIRAEII